MARGRHAALHVTGADPSPAAADAPADLWSVGVVLREALSGRRRRRPQRSRTSGRRATPPSRARSTAWRLETSSKKSAQPADGTGSSSRMLCRRSSTRRRRTARDAQQRWPRCASAGNDVIAPRPRRPSAERHGRAALRPEGDGEDRGAAAQAGKDVRLRRASRPLSIRKTRTHWAQVKVRRSQWMYGFKTAAKAQIKAFPQIKGSHPATLVVCSHAVITRRR